MEKRVNLWRDTLLPFLTALGAVFPVLTEDVARITTAIETLSPSTSSKQTVGEGDRELQGDTQTGK